MTVKIVTDSTCDLPEELRQALDITVVPVYIGYKGRTYRDGIDIAPDELYQKISESDVPLTTSQPPPANFVDVYERLLKETDEILSIHVTSKLSGIYNSALQARETISGKNRIEVMDSASVSMGLGLITLSAARMAQSGASLVNVMDEARQAMSQVHIWGIFDTLKYILQGGRLGKAKVLLGNLINVKPMLTMRDGLIQPTGFVRTRLKGIDKLIDNFKGFPDIGEVGIVHSNNLDEARSLKARISSVIDRSKIYISRLGPALGVHGGPGTLIIAMKEQASISGNENQVLETNRKLINLPSFHKPRLNIATRQ
jgi:DegV family protein with EDD domain